MILVVGILALLLASRFLNLQDRFHEAVNGINRLGAWGPVLFIIIYAVATVFLVPASALTLGAGAVFGVAWGSIYVSAASMAGAVLAFLIGRYGVRDWVFRRVAGNPKFAEIDRAVAAEGWKIVLLARLSPVFPFTLLNYAFGVTRVSFRAYALASWIGMMPGTVMYVYIGSLAQLAGKRARTPAEWALYAVGLMATVAVTVYITRIAKRALAKQAGSR